MIRRLLTMSALLLIPAIAYAGPVRTVELRFYDLGNSGFEFGSAPVHGWDDVYSVDAGFGPPSLKGTVDFTSGPLRSLTSGCVSCDSVYEYGPGLLTFDAEWTLNGSTHRGGFTVPIVDEFGFFVYETSKDLLEFSSLGRGLLDAELAEYLGVGRQILGGSLDLYVYGIDGDGTSPFRSGRIDEGRVSLEVPEPPITAFAILATMSMLLRLRHRSAD